MGGTQSFEISGRNKAYKALGQSNFQSSDHDPNVGVVEHLYAETTHEPAPWLSCKPSGDVSVQPMHVGH